MCVRARACWGQGGYEALPDAPWTPWSLSAIPKASAPPLWAYSHHEGRVAVCHHEHTPAPALPSRTLNPPFSVWVDVADSCRDMSSEGQPCIDSGVK